MGEETRIMDNFLASVSQGAKDLADATERKAKTTKAQAEIMYAERQIKQIKEAFGVAVWDPMVSQDEASAQALLEEAKAKVAEQEAYIAELQATIERLSVPGGR